MLKGGAYFLPVSFVEYIIIYMHMEVDRGLLIDCYGLIG